MDEKNPRICQVSADLAALDLRLPAGTVERLQAHPRVASVADYMEGVLANVQAHMLLSDRSGARQEYEDMISVLDGMVRSAGAQG